MSGLFIMAKIYYAHLVSHTGLVHPNVVDGCGMDGKNYRIAHVNITFDYE
jgi:hypothetical protein